jgi:hypothetical protein
MLAAALVVISSTEFKLMAVVWSVVVVPLSLTPFVVPADILSASLMLWAMVDVAWIVAPVVRVAKPVIEAAVELDRIPPLRPAESGAGWPVLGSNRLYKRHNRSRLNPPQNSAGKFGL